MTGWLVPETQMDRRLSEPFATHGSIRISQKTCIRRWGYLENKNCLGRVVRPYGKSLSFWCDRLNDEHLWEMAKELRNR